MTTTTGRSTRSTEAAERLVRAQKLLGEAAGWVDQLGGWGHTGLKTDVARIATYLMAEDEDRIEFNSMSAWVSLWVGGKGIGEDALEAITRVHDAFRTSSDVQATYVDLVRKANGAVPLPEGVDWPFTVELLSIADTFADDAYQRPTDDEFVRTLLMSFDEQFVGVIDVSQRGDGSYAILDGRQRTSVMKKIGKTTCWCAVYPGMSIAQEAEFFYRKNKVRKNVAQFYTFRARLLSGDPTAKIIDEIVTSAGFQLGALGDSQDVIGSVVSVEKAYATPTENEWGNALSPTLQTIRKCWYGRKSSLDGTLIRGLSRFFSIYAPSEVNLKHLQEALEGLGPVLVLGRSRDAQGNRNIGSKIDVAVALTIAEIHNTGIDRNDRLSIDLIPKPLRARRKRTA